MKTIIIICLILSVCIGCGDPRYRIEKVPGKKNTFKLGLGLPLRAPLDGVGVYELTDPNDESLNLVWSIDNKDRHYAAYFRIAVPQIPDGYIQIVPSPPEQFQLRKGHLYRIVVCYTGGASTCVWTAE